MARTWGKKGGRVGEAAGATAAGAGGAAPTAGGATTPTAGGATTPTGPGALTPTVIPAGGPGALAAATVPSTAAEKMAVQEAAATMEGVDQGEMIVGNLAEIERVLKVKGIKINPNFLDNKIKPAIEEATLKSLRTALFEYGLITGAMEKTWDFTGKGFTTPEEYMKDMSRWIGEGGENVKKTFAGGGEKKAEPAKPGAPAPAKAAGGYVARIGADGIAQVIRPAPGEGLTSIGVGERIVRAGGGGGQQVTVRLELAGDAKRFIKAQAADAISEHAAAAPRR